MFRTKKSTEMKETVYDTGTTVFGKWRITKFIGKGSFGRVFQIERIDGLLSEVSALKVITVPRSEEELQSLRSGGMSTAQAKKYLEGMANDVVREVGIMSKLKGTTNIVSYEDCEKIPHENGIGWDILIRMELLHPLLTYAYEHPFSRRDIIKLGIDTCKALELCQKYNIIHRDVKPENIFVSEIGDFKLGDFGISRSFEHTVAASTRVGTCNYMAPEIFHGEKYGFSVDTYSLGLVMYRFLNKNRLPFLPPAPQEFMLWDQEAAFARRMAGEPIPPPSYSQGMLPEIVLRACAPDAKNRYASPSEMRLALEKIPDDPSDSELIYPDENTLENLREHYASQGSTPGGYADRERGNASASGKTAGLFADGASTELIPPEENSPPEIGPAGLQRTKQRKKVLVIAAAAACLCTAVIAGGLLGFRYGRNAPGPDGQSTVSPPLSVSSLPPVLPSSSPLPATPETDFKIVDGVLAEYLGSGGDVVIPDSVASIGELAFSGCEGLTSITIPDGVTSIGSSAFWGCTGLTSVTIPDSVTSIGRYAFWHCECLTGITIPNSVTSIGEGTFNGCTGLASITIPNSVTSIESGAFFNCAGLTSISIPDSVTSIGASAFSDCTGLISVTIPDSVASIGGGAFSGCMDLTSVTIPHSVASIEGSIFYGCTDLTSVTIPDSVTSIGVSAFGGCANLKEAHYAGTQAQWNAITIADGNDPLFNAAIYFAEG